MPLNKDLDLRFLSRHQLHKRFASNTGRIKIQTLMKAALIQLHGRIVSGKEPPIRGNVRTIWYRYIKPILSHLDEEDQITNPYNIMVRVFASLAQSGKIRYMDFGLADQNWENRRIGKEHPNVIVFSEKAGWVYFLRQVHKQHSVSTIALGGMPSVLSSEYTAAHTLKALNEMGLVGEPVHLIGVVDWDPSGELVGQTFQRQLSRCGLGDSTLDLVVHPRHFTDEERKFFKFPLPKTTRRSNDSWVERTGGVDGGLFGLEAESMRLDLVEYAVNRAVRRRTDTETQ